MIVCFYVPRTQLKIFLPSFRTLIWRLIVERVIVSRENKSESLREAR